VITIEIPNPPEGWIEDATNQDMFRRDHCGYWLRGVEYDKRLGWLCWEEDTDGDRPPFGNEPNRYVAIDTWRAGGDLPSGWHRLDRATATRAYVEGVKRYGVEWYDSPDSDASRYDILIQLALLGEIRYS